MPLKKMHEGLWRETWSVFSHFQFKSDASILALKVGLATSLAIFLALFFHFQDAFWAGISAFLVSADKLGNSLQKTLLRIGCTLMGAIGGLVCVHFFMENPVLLSLVTFLVMAYTIYRGMRDDNFYIWIFTSVTFLMVVAELMTTGDAKLTLDIGIYRALDIIIGSLAGLMVSIVLFPKHATREMAERVPLLKAALADYYQHLAEQFLHEMHTPDRALRQNSAEAIAEMKALAKMAATESYFLEAPHEAKTQFIVMMEMLFKNMEEFEVSMHRVPAGYLQHFHGELSALKKIVIQLLTLQDAPTLIAAKKILSELYVRYDHIRREGINFQFAPAQIIVFQDFMMLHQILLDLIEQNLTRGAPHKNLFKFKPPSFTERLKLDRYFILFGIKVALCVLSIPLIWTRLSLPGANQVGVSIGAVLQLDLSNSKQKSLMRIYGCLAGALMALLILIIIEPESLALLLTLVFAAGCLCSYLHNSEAKTAYLGTQALVAFLMGIIVDYSPALIPDPAIERLAGIIAGVVTLFLVLEWLWPFSKESVVAHYEGAIDHDFARMREALEAYFEKVDFSLLETMSLLLKRIESQRTRLATLEIENITLQRQRSSYLEKSALRLTQMETFICLIENHILILKAYRAWFVPLFTALTARDTGLLQAEKQLIFEHLKGLREQAERGDFLPVELSIILGSALRKSLLLGTS